MNREIMQSGGIYQIVNTVNGKRYVGSAKCLHTRKCTHFSALSLGKHHSRHLQSAVKKNGLDAFRFEPLAVCAAEDLLVYEQAAIDGLNPEYNTCRVAGNTLGVECSDETRAKIRNALIGRKLTAEHRLSISLGGMGRVPTEEALVNIRRAAMLKAEDPEWRRKVSEGKKGIPCSAAHRESISKTKTGVPAKLSEEGRLRKNAKIAEANRVREITDLHRQNSSIAQQNRPGVERFEFRGEHRTVLSLAEEFSIGRHVVRKRLNAGWDIERAVTQPTRRSKRNGNT